MINYFQNMSSLVSIAIFFILIVCFLLQSTTATTTRETDFIGKWKLIESENADEFLKKLGIGWFTRNAVAFLKPLMIISIDGNKWNIEQQSTFRNIKWQFKLNTVYDTTSADGREVKSIFTFVDGKLIHVETAKTDGEVDSKIIRSIENGKMVTHLEADGVVAKRIYERVVE